MCHNPSEFFPITVQHLVFKSLELGLEQRENWNLPHYRNEHILKHLIFPKLELKLGKSGHYRFYSLKNYRLNCIFLTVVSPLLRFVGPFSGPQHFAIDFTTQGATADAAHQGRSASCDKQLRKGNRKGLGRKRIQCSWEVMTPKRLLDMSLQLPCNKNQLITSSWNISVSVILTWNTQVKRSVRTGKFCLEK